jgi:class 3 adenylate cyclase
MMTVDTARELQELADQLDSYGWAAELLDDRWRLVWVSEELLTMYGEPDPERVGVGDHVLVSRSRGLARDVVTRESAERWMRTNGPFMVEAAGGSGEILELVDSDLARILESCEPRPAPPLWTSAFDFSRNEFFGRLTYVGARVHNAEGELLGYVFVYSLDVPASIAALLSRGDRSMHERMAALVEPGQHSAAVLFADLEASGSLSRQLPSPVYFRLVRDIRSALEAEVAGCGGIVGKHVGDGVTAYFLSEQIGSASGAARAALETARRLPQGARDAAAALADEGLPVGPESCRLRVGLHWGPSLYVGQVASQGRLEITALGDEMNEGARIEQSAAGGQVLASKPLLERLSPDDASALGLDPARVAYRALADIDGVSDKAKRDAGSIAVTDVSESLSTSA